MKIYIHLKTQKKKRKKNVDYGKCMSDTTQIKAISNKQIYKSRYMNILFSIV